MGEHLTEVMEPDWRAAHKGGMRLLLAILAVLGLLLTPAAATAATARCLHGGHGDMAMPMPSGVAPAMGGDMTDDAGATSMPCCDDDAKAPAHDSQACAQDCALMGAAPAALPEVAGPTAPPMGHVALATARLKALQGQAPASPERPPRSFI